MASMDSSLSELRELGVSRCSIEHREAVLAPMQTLYVLNESDLVTGFYSITPASRPYGLPPARDIPDVLELRGMLHHYSASGESPHPDSVKAVARAKRWFDIMWSNTHRA
ncbi:MULTISPECIES: hypothetical protein [unclassified Streptomyces]|uniref:hypothetical protein n=1 Tax=Streptomyces sp. NBRC 14336 TaxID=3030992 RepID=UPI00255604BF|nr:hypothetical protein [Streptomyces sp. NBRC 14336]WBO82031.1 hypothetical protein SBE_005925 [Streptomyces sp. SBE_14.2]